MKKKCLLIIGNSSIDNVLTKDKIFHQSISGGNSLHASMAAKIISENVSVLTNVPANFPKKYIDKLIEHGIDTSLINRVDKKIDWQELFLYDENGDRIDNLFINLDENLDGVKLNDNQVKKLIKDSKIDVYSYNNFREDNAPNICLIPKDWKIESVHLAPTDFYVHKYVLSMDIPIKTLDPGKYLINLNYEEVKDLVSKTTVFAPSKKEMMYIFPNQDVILSTIKLGKDCNTNIVCKNGNKGCYVYSSEKDCCYEIGTYPEKEVLNLTGAGDSFCGALNAALTSGYTLLDSVKMATVVASKAIETISATDRNKIDLEFVKTEYLKVLHRKVICNEK